MSKVPNNIQADEVFLYILAEHKSNEFCKVGMCARRELYDRLRHLNQGNPRQLNFKYLWIATNKIVRMLEKTVKIEKDPFNDAGRTEWYEKSPDDMYEYLSNIMDNSSDEVIPVVDEWIVPYYAKNKRDCLLDKRYFTGRPLLPQLRDVYNEYLSKKALTTNTTHL